MSERIEDLQRICVGLVAKTSAQQLLIEWLLQQMIEILCRGQNEMPPVTLLDAIAEDFSEGIASLRVPGVAQEMQDEVSHQLASQIETIFSTVRRRLIEECNAP